MTFPGRALLITKGRSPSAVSADPRCSPVSYGRALLAPRTSSTGFEQSEVSPAAGEGPRASLRRWVRLRAWNFPSLPSHPLRAFYVQQQAPGILYNPVHKCVRRGLYKIDYWGEKAKHTTIITP